MVCGSDEGTFWELVGLSSVKQFEHVNAIVTFKHSRITDIKTWM